MSYVEQLKKDSQLNSGKAVTHHLDLEIHPSGNQNLWIMKPGEHTNRGRGIKVYADIDELVKDIKYEFRPGKTHKLSKTLVVQKYIHTPLLFKGRKFDIRCFALFTCINGMKRGFFYQDGYLRTSSKEFTLKDTDDRIIHLTNDAVQKKSKEYGKFESCNKVSFSDFDKYSRILIFRYLSSEGHQNAFHTKIYPRIKQLVRDTFMCSYDQMNSDDQMNAFEIFGYDFMLDEDLNTYLIEVILIHTISKLNFSLIYFIIPISNI